MKLSVGHSSGASLCEEALPDNLQTSLNPSAQAVQWLLQSPIKFVLATDITFKDELRMAPTLRRRRKDTNTKENISQRQHSLVTHCYSSRWQRQASNPTLSRGLYNMRNDCYRNVILQALLHVPKFVNWLELQHEDCNFQSCVACRLKTLCLRYWDIPKKETRHEMGNLVSCLRGTDTFRRSQWNWQEQHDAPEFYGHLVNSLTETNRRVLSIVRGLLGHTLAVTATCPLCQKTDRQADHQPTDYTLNVNFQRGAPLESLLRTNNFGPNIAPGRRCDKCEKTADTSRRMRIWNAPDILVISINRFRLERGKYVKNLDQVIFCQDLDLTSFTENNTILKYHLLSVVHHLGSRNQGHYKAVAKGPSGTWEELDDEHVKKVPIGAALKPSLPWTPYMLFYAKIEEYGLVKNSATTPDIHSASNGYLRDESHKTQRAAKGHIRPSQSNQAWQNRVHKYRGPRRRKR